MTKAKKAGERPYWKVWESATVDGKSAEVEIGGGWVKDDGSVLITLDSPPRGKYVKLRRNPWWTPPVIEGVLIVGETKSQRECANSTDPKAGVAEAIEKPRRVALLPKRRP